MITTDQAESIKTIKQLCNIYKINIMVTQVIPSNKGNVAKEVSSHKIASAAFTAAVSDCCMKGLSKIKGSVIIARVRIALQEWNGFTFKQQPMR